MSRLLVSFFNRHKHVDSTRGGVASIQDEWEHNSNHDINEVNLNLFKLGVLTQVKQRVQNQKRCQNIYEWTNSEEPLSRLSSKNFESA